MINTSTLRVAPPIVLGPIGGVQLRELTRADLPALWAITPRETFQYFLAEPAEWTLASFAMWASSHLFRSDQLPMLIEDANGNAVGSSSFMDLLPAHRHVEIGCTWYAPHCRGTRVNPASKLLMLNYAFSSLFVSSDEVGYGAVRVTLKCDARNLHSQRAIAKLGATREGTLRSHRTRPDGYVRDTVYFSILPNEWPAVRTGLEARVSGGD
jgi:RimJ/RimL family protein N-acetyltransferase